MKKTILIVLTLMAFTAWDASAKKDKSTEQKEVVPFDRGIGIAKTCFIPKGSIGSGVSFSYSDYSLGNGTNDVGYNMLFSLIQGLQGNLKSYGIAPHISYFIADNISVGARFDYNRTSFGLGGVNLVLTDDIQFGLSNFNYLKQSYTGSITLRDYIPLGASKRFAMFAELRATGGYAQSASYKMVETNKFGTYQDIYNFSVGVIPGVIAFFTNEVAFEISVGLLGFDYQKVKQVTDQVYESEMEKSGANFKINLLAINFGLSFYIPTGAHSTKNLKLQK